MFIAILVCGTVTAIAWINKDKPPLPPAPPGSLDGHLLCSGCRHPMVAQRPARRTTIIEENL